MTRTLRNRRVRAAVLAVSSLAASGLILGPIVTPHVAVIPLPANEDDPGWRCDLQGNRVCAIQTPTGPVYLAHDAAGLPIGLVPAP